MNVAKEYFKRQFKNKEFNYAYLEEKVKLDIEYHLEELKRDVEVRSPRQNLLIKKVDLKEVPG